MTRRQEKYLAVIEKHKDGITARRLRMVMLKTSVKTMLDNLIELGKLRKEGEGRKAKYFAV